MIGVGVCLSHFLYADQQVIKYSHLGKAVQKGATPTLMFLGLERLNPPSDS